MSLQKSALTHQKKRFHKAVKYLQITTACKTIQLTAEALWPLEEDRLNFVQACENRKPPTSPCTQEEYEETIENQMVEIATEGNEAKQIALNLKPGEYFEPAEYLSFTFPSSDR